MVIFINFWSIVIKLILSILDHFYRSKGGGLKSILMKWNKIKWVNSSVYGPDDKLTRSAINITRYKWYSGIIPFLYDNKPSNCNSTLTCLELMFSAQSSPKYIIFWIHFLTKQWINRFVTYKSTQLIIFCDWYHDLKYKMGCLEAFGGD